MKPEGVVNDQRKNALIIFVKNPELGKVKTRLAKSIGPQRAMEVYIQLLKYTRQVTNQLSDVNKYVYYAEAITAVDIWDSTMYDKRLQYGENLGERMQGAFADCFEEGNDKVVIIGSDCPDIQLEHLQAAFVFLDTADVVIGPVTDGGYYLLGMKTCYRELFKEISWSTSAVFQQTRQKMETLGLSYHLLEMLSDVDELESYERMKQKFSL
jgi:rSAM/selenodomain-associated transferase 1